MVGGEYDFDDFCESDEEEFFIDKLRRMFSEWEEFLVLISKYFEVSFLFLIVIVVFLFVLGWCLLC